MIVAPHIFKRFLSFIIGPIASTETLGFLLDENTYVNKIIVQNIDAVDTAGFGSSVLTRDWVVRSKGSSGSDVIVTPRGHFVPGRMDAEEDVVVSLMGEGYSARYEDIRIIFANLIGTTSEFRQMDPFKRGCLYPNEVSLDFFPVYSESNCVLEEAWKKARRECRCVPW